MISFREFRGWPAVLGVAMCIATSGSEAAAAAESADDAITAAKRDYDAITASKAGAGQSGLALPKQRLPDLDAAPPPLPTVPLPVSPYRKNGAAKNDADEKAEKSENWLVDAMTKTDEADADAADNLPHATAKVEAKGDLMALAIALEREEKAAEKAREEREAREPDAAELAAMNPLGAYMTSWLSSRDLALLNPVSDGTSARGADKMFLDAPGGSASDASVAASPAMFDQLADLDRGSGIDRMAAPATNPYLVAPADLSAGMPTEFSMPITSAPGVPAPVSPPTIFPPADAKPPTSPATLSETLKAQDESRYFKQLKRF